MSDMQTNQTPDALAEHFFADVIVQAVGLCIVIDQLAEQQAVPDDWYTEKAQGRMDRLRESLTSLRDMAAHPEDEQAGKREPLTPEQRRELFAKHLLHTTPEGGELYDVELLADDIERAHGITGEQR
jgi:hypothetical protein